MILAYGCKLVQDVDIIGRNRPQPAVIPRPTGDYEISI